MNGSKTLIKILQLALLISTFALANMVRAQEVCVPCTDVNASGAKVKEAFVCVPKRRADDGTKIPAAQLFYREQGKGTEDSPTLVFLHGIGFSSLYWACQQAELSKQYRTIALDLRGFGCSEKTDPLTTAYNYELFATDLHVVLKKLCVKNPILVGHSLGGGVSLFYNNRYPGQIKKLVLIGTNPAFVVPDSYAQPGCDPSCPTEVVPTSPTCWPFFTELSSTILALPALIAEIGFENFVKNALLPRFYNESCTEELVNAQDSFVQTSLQTGEAVTLNVLTNFDVEINPTADLRPILSSISIPTLITFGTIDVVVPPGADLFLFSQIPGAWLATFDQKGHACHVTDFKRFNCELRDFVTGASTQCCVCPLVKPTGPCPVPCTKKKKKHR